MIIDFGLTQLLILFSFIFGVLIASRAVEELKPGKKYFNVLRVMTLGILLATSIWQLRFEWITLILFGIAYVLFGQLRKSWKISLEIELCLGSIAFFSAYRYDVLFIAAASILHNLVLGTLWFAQLSARHRSLTNTVKLACRSLQSATIVIIVLCGLVLL